MLKPHWTGDSGTLLPEDALALCHSIDIPEQQVKFQLVAVHICGKACNDRHPCMLACTTSASTSVHTIFLQYYPLPSNLTPAVPPICAKLAGLQCRWRLGVPWAKLCSTKEITAAGEHSDKRSRCAKCEGAGQLTTVQTKLLSVNSEITTDKITWPHQPRSTIFLDRSDEIGMGGANLTSLACWISEEKKRR